MPTDHRTCFCDIVVFFGFLATSLIAKIVESRTTLLGNTLQRSRQRVLRYRTMRERPTAFAPEGNGGLIVTPHAVTFTNRDLIVALAARLRLPALYPLAFYAKAGGLVSYGIDVPSQFQQGAGYVDRILRGAKPADLPVQYPTKFQLGSTLPQALVRLRLHSRQMDTPCSQHFLDHGHALFHAHMLVLNHASNFIEHFDCTLIVGDKQGLQNRFEIINLVRPRFTLQCRMSSNFVYKIVDDITHGYSPLYGVLHNRTLNEINDCIPDRARVGAQLFRPPNVGLALHIQAVAVRGAERE